MTLTYRSVKGSRLTSAEGDGNISTLDGRLVLVEAFVASPAIPMISGFTQSGNTFSVTMTSGPGFGPFDLPSPNWNFRDDVGSPLGDWAATTFYYKDDTFREGGALYLVKLNHTSASSFDPDATDGSAHRLYATLMPTLPLALDDLTDVTITSPSSGEGLKFNGTAWVNGNWFLSLGGGTLTGALTLAGDPTLALHAATKQYVDGIALNVGRRSRVRVATTANITIATALNSGDTLDGVTLATGDLVLVKDQSTAADNGVYVVGVTPARFAEFDTFNEHPGSLIVVEEGTANAATVWLCTSNAGGALGSSAIDFSQTSVTGALLAANNLSDLTDPVAARGNLGSTTVGDAVFIAANAAAARGSLGSTTVGDAVFIAANAGAARSAIGAVIGTDVQAFDAQLFSNIPQNSKSAAYTTVLTDAQKHILHPSADTTARTFTIDSNANVAYPIGTTITFVNQHSGGVITIAITSDTMRLAGTGTTGSRTLAADGIATALKITATEWIISGTGLT